MEPVEPVQINVYQTALQIRASQWSIATSPQSLTAHIYHVMIIVTSGFPKKFFFYLI